MSDSVRRHRRQPTRLLRPWDSPGKNTGVGCHFLFQCMKVKSESEVAQSCPTLSNPMVCSLPGSSVHGIFQARVLEWGAIAFSKSVLTYLQSGRKSENSFPAGHHRLRPQAMGGLAKRSLKKDGKAQPCWGVREPGSDSGFVTLTVWP